ncbi:MAG: LOG family protein [Bacteroidota bacterium]
MAKAIHKAEKAYRNVEFLNSPDARTVRLLAEFLEPMQRFRKQGIKDTIVFFGSARIKSKFEASKALRQLESKLRTGRAVSRAIKTHIRDARTDLEMSRYYEDAAELSRLLTRWSKKLFQQNRFVVCSGGGPGIMEAANKGARLAKGRSIGLNISLPFEQYPNKYVPAELSFDFHYFFMRKFWFVYLGKALVVFPGGFGTFDEMMEVLTLSQTKKLRKKITVLLYGREYWSRIIDFDALVRLRLINAGDLNLFAYADSPKEAFQYLVGELKKNYPKETEEA